jgi:hypothetical protein
MANITIDTESYERKHGKPVGRGYPGSHVGSQINAIGGLFRLGDLCRLRGFRTEGVL